MRKKTITLDGQSWTIAPLTMREVNEWLEKQREALDMPESAARDRRLKELWEEFLAMGLNNVHRLEDGKFPEPMPTPLVKADEIPHRLDLHSFEVLREEMAAFSGLVRPKTPAAAGPQLVEMEPPAAAQSAGA